MMEQVPHSDASTPTSIDSGFFRHINIDSDGSILAQLTLGLKHWRFDDIEIGTEKYTIFFKNKDINKNSEELIYFKSSDSTGGEAIFGVNIKYIFYKTKCYLTVNAVLWAQGYNLDLSTIAVAPVLELLDTMGIVTHPQRSIIIEKKGMPTISFMKNDELVMLVLGKNSTLTRQLNQILEYSDKFWNRLELLASTIRRKYILNLQSRKKYWMADDLAKIDLGDLICLESTRPSASSRILIKSSLDDISLGSGLKKYGVYLSMSDNTPKVHFDVMNSLDPIDSAIDDNTLSSETVILEINAGTTVINLKDLVTVKEGTIVELQNHSLPFVTISVGGTGLFKGELVYFQDQIMVQITSKIV